MYASNMLCLSRAHQVPINIKILYNHGPRQRKDWWWSFGSIIEKALMKELSPFMEMGYRFELCLCSERSKDIESDEKEEIQGRCLILDLWSLRISTSPIRYGHFGNSGNLRSNSLPTLIMPRLWGCEGRDMDLTRQDIYWYEPKESGKIKQTIDWFRRNG